MEHWLDTRRASNTFHPPRTGFTSMIFIVIVFTSANRRFQFQKHSQQFICTHNETLPVAAMCVSNEYRSPFAIYRRDTAPPPTALLRLSAMISK
jgi:hypothetical protein